MSLCNSDRVLDNWAYKAYLKITDNRIKEILLEKEKEVKKDYEKALNNAFLKLNIV